MNTVHKPSTPLQAVPGKRSCPVFVIVTNRYSVTGTAKRIHPATQGYYCQPVDVHDGT